MLKEIIKNAYAPYSNYRVAAEVVTNDGKSFYGVNVENASYGGTICAERNAINSAISAGYKKGDFKSLTVMVDGDKTAFPCFICRQTIVEFFDMNDDLILIAGDNVLNYKMSDIIVNRFSKEDLIWNQDL